MKGWYNMDDLRTKVKYLKVFKNIQYQDIAKSIGIKPKSFYNWLNGQYEFNTYRTQRLKDILNTL